MLKPKHLLLFLTLIATFSASALTDKQVRQQIKENPQRAGSIYYAYPYTTDSLAPVPEGYKPFYMSHYGRHGSRWVINEKLHSALVNTLIAANCDSNLTALGKELLQKVERLNASTTGHWGELSPLGNRQHKQIAGRMMNRFPSLFDGQTEIIARSSTCLLYK